MKKKLVSLICALTMVFSVVSGMTMISVHAADATVTGTATYNAADNTAAVTVSYSGVTKLKSFQIKIPVDTDIFEAPTLDEYGEVADIEMSDVWSSVTGASSYVDGVVTYAYAAQNAKGYVTAESADVFTLTLKLKEGVTVPDEGIEIALTTPAFTDSTADGDVAHNEIAENVTIVNALLTPASAPTETPTAEPATATPGAATATPGVVRPTINPDNRPTKAPVPTVAPVVTPEPTDAPIVGAYVKGTATYNAENNTAAVTVSYGNVTKLKSFQIKIPVDTDIFEAPTLDEYGEVADIEMSDVWSSVTGASSYIDGVVTYAYAAQNAKGYVTAESADVFTLTLKLKEGVTIPDEGIEIALTTPAFTDSTDDGDVAHNEIAENVTIVNATLKNTVTPDPGVTPTPTPTVAPADTTSAVKDVVGSENSASIKDAYAADNTVEIGLNVTFKDADGKVVNAVYGTDFVVVDADGNALSEDAYNNIINGYDTEGLISLIDGNAKFYFYNDKIVSAETDVIDYTNSDYIGDRYTETIVDVPDDDDNKDNGKWTWKSATSVRVDKSITLDAVYTDGNGVEHDGDEIEYSFKSGSKSSYATLKDDVLTGDKKGSVQIVATYVDDTTKTSQRTIRITDTTSTGNGGGTTGSTGAGGDIAPGNNTNVPTINNNVYFTDIWSVPWAQEAIYGLASKNIINGRSATEFDPEANVTRAEFAKMLVSTFGFTNFAGASSNFADVPTSHWAYNFVSIAAQIGAVTGYDATTFGPNDYITREDMAVMIYRVVTGHNVNMPYVEEAITFTDDADIYGYAKDAVTALQRADVINGMGDGTFAPKANATRAQAAVMLYNFVK